MHLFKDVEICSEVVALGLGTSENWSSARPAHLHVSCSPRYQDVWIVLADHYDLTSDLKPGERAAADVSTIIVVKEKANPPRIYSHNKLEFTTCSRSVTTVLYQVFKLFTLALVRV